MAESAQNTEELAGEFFILGISNSGKTFRPSDWAERLAGVMSCFRPQDGRNSHLKYSVYVRPTVVNNIKAVVVNRALQNIEPLAYHFVCDFAKDNDLQVVDACFVSLPGDPKP
jgi:Protein of unknown function (DUF3579)